MAAGILRRDGPAFAIAAVAAFAVLIALGSATTFRVDDWELIANRTLADPASLIRPWNEQLIVVPAVIFRAIFALVGLTSYLPYLVVLLALHIATAVVVRRFVADLAGRAAGLAAGVLFLFLGAGYENLDTAFQIGQVIATGAGLAALHAVAIQRRPGLAAGLLMISLASHAIGGAYLVGVVVVLALSDRRGLRWMLVPGVVGGLWFVALDVPTFAAHDEPLGDAIRAIPQFMLAGPFAAAGALFGLGLAGGVIIVAASAALVRLGRIRPSNGILIGAALASILAEYAFIAFSRAAFGIEATTWSRYVYSAVPLALIVAAAWVGDRATGRLSEPAGRSPGAARTGLVLAALTAVAIAGNLRAYADARGIPEEFGQRVRAAAAIVAWSPEAGPLRSDPVLPAPARLRAILAESGSPVRDRLAPFVVGPVSGTAALQACREMLGEAVDPAPCLAAVAAAVGR